MLDTLNAGPVPAIASAVDSDSAPAGERQFIEALPLINSIIDRLCRQNCLPGGDRDEFRSIAMLKLIENDYEVLRRFRGTSTLRTYLLVVLQRVLLDHRTRQWGKWRPSTEARRRGAVAIRLEQLISRDGMALEEALANLRTNHGVHESPETLRAIASQLPTRYRVRLEPEDSLVDAVDGQPLPDAVIEQGDNRACATSVRAALRATVTALPAEDRLILKLRFADGLQIVEIARLLRIDARPLYRRVERILGQLRAQLREQGIDREAARQLLDSLGAA
jgi:RNA polymerase sigma factor (sigma-70 family)